MRDEIVEEVHRVREELLAEHGGDLHAYVETLRQAEAEHPERLVSLNEWQARQDKPRQEESPH